MKNRLSIVVLSSVLLFGMSHSLSAQVVQRGLMLEYNEELAKSPLGGVEVVVRGAPSSVSDASGGFELEFLTQSGGERVSVTRIEKPGYEVFNKEALEQWNINPEEPFRIVMCESGRFKRIRDNYSRVSSESYARQQASEESRLRELLEDGALKEEEYRKELYELKVEYQTKLDDIESYVDRFARIDLSELNEAEREIIRLVQAGDMEGAIAKYEAQDLVGKYRAETEDIREIETARESLDEAEQAKREGRDSLFAAVRRQLETYVLAGGEENYAKAGNLLREVALADTTNLEAVWEYVTFAYDQKDYREAESASLLLLRKYEENACILDPKRLAMTHANLGAIYDELFNFDRAEEYLKRALDIFRNSTLEDRGKYLTKTYSLLAEHYNRASDYDNSIIYHKKAVEEQSNICKISKSRKDSLELVRILNNYGNLCRNVGLFDEAEKVYTEALSFLCDIDSEDQVINTLVASINNNLGVLFLRTNHVAAAEEVLLVSFKIYKRLYEVNPEAYLQEISMSALNLASVYKRKGSYNYAEEYYSDALSGYLKLYSIDNDAYRKDLAVIQYNIGDLYRDTDRNKEAIELYLESYNNFQVLFRKNPEAFRADIADVQNNLGLSYGNCGEYNIAEKYFLLAEENFKELAHSYPEVYDYRLTMVQNNLGCLFLDRGENDLAEKYFLRVLEKRREMFHAEPEHYALSYAVILFNIANLYYDSACYEKACKCYREAADIYEHLFYQIERLSDYSIKLIAIYHLIGLSYFQQEQYENAISYFGKCLKMNEVQEGIAVSYGFDVTSVINMLAYSYAFVGDMISALQTIDRAIEIEPQDINLYDSKGEILLMQGDRDGAMKMWEKIMELDPSFAEKHPDSVLYTKLFKETAE